MSVEVCHNCGASKRHWVRKNINPLYPPDYDWYCGKCGVFIRVSSN